MDAERKSMTYFSPISQPDSQRFETSFRQLARQKQKQLADKIDRNISKQIYINKIQQELEARLRMKSGEIIKKLNKSVEIKQKNIDKVREKCHMRHAYEHEKIKQFKKKETMQRNKQWKQSKRLTEWTHSKSSLEEKELRSEENQQKLGDQLAGNKKMNESSPLNKRENRVKFQILPARNLREVKNMRTFTLPKHSVIVNRKIEEQNDLSNEKKIKSFNSFREQKEIDAQKIEKIQSQKEIKELEQIKKFNEKMEKLQEARMKKHKMQMEKQMKIHSILEYKKERLGQAIKNAQKIKKQHKRAKTQGSIENEVFGDSRICCSPKKELFKQWEQQNKIRKVKLFEIRLRKGQDYMNLMKDKNIKTKMVKELQSNSIEKKLYLERIKLHELSYKRYKF